MKTNRRSFFAALAAPLLAPLRKLLPKPALSKGDVVGATFTGRGMVHQSEVCFWAHDSGLYVFDGDRKTLISHQPKFEHKIFSLDLGSYPAPEA